nr:MAG TPA: hypothetical protein [Bacteriophage sp.]
MSLLWPESQLSLFFCSLSSIIRHWTYSLILEIAKDISCVERERPIIWLMLFSRMFDILYIFSANLQVNLRF